MIKHILVPTDGSEQALIGASYAVGVAKHLGASVHGLFVVDIKLVEGPILRDVSASLGTAPFANYQGNISMILEQRGESALDVVSKKCAEAGVPSTSEQATGVVSRMIVEKSELRDLVVMGRNGITAELRGVAGALDRFRELLQGGVTDKVTRHASIPVLVVT